MEKLDTPILSLLNFLKNNNEIKYFNLKIKNDVNLLFLQVSPQSPRYLVIPQPSMSVLRIDSAKAGKDDAKYDCVAENGVGDAVVASATLSIYPGRPTYLSLSVEPLTGFSKLEASQVVPQVVRQETERLDKETR